LRPTQDKADQITGSANGGPAAVHSPQRANPWLAGAGLFRDDPLFDEWQQAIAEYRREVNGIAGAP
jgi:hypothetical protein